MSDLYYVGDIGDICNVDWFFADNHHQLKDVTAVEFFSVPGRGLEVEVHYSQGCKNRGLIVPNPHLQKNGTAPAPSRKLANGFKTTDIVWHATRGSEWVKCRVIGGDGDKLRLIRLLNSSRFTAQADDVTKCEPAATHRCNCSSQPGERHWSDCAALIGVEKQSAPYHVYDKADFKKPERTEAERMADFFRGKPTW